MIDIKGKQVESFIHVREKEITLGLLIFLFLKRNCWRERQLWDSYGGKKNWKNFETS